MYIIKFRLYFITINKHVLQRVLMFHVGSDFGMKGSLMWKETGGNPHLYIILSDAFCLLGLLLTPCLGWAGSGHTHDVLQRKMQLLR